MKILGIDPGLRVTGYGLISLEKTNLVYVGSGIIRIPVENLPFRLKIILDSIKKIVDEYSPNCAAIEKIFVNINPQSTLNLGHARGAAICGLISRDLSVIEYTALQVKKAVVGQGMAKKQQVQEMVKKLLYLNSLPSTDAADALAVAICHAHSFKAISNLKKNKSKFSKKEIRMRGGRLVY